MYLERSSNTKAGATLNFVAHTKYIPLRLMYKKWIPSPLSWRGRGGRGEGGRSGEGGIENKLEEKRETGIE